jgi:hypothetical protein
MPLTVLFLNHTLTHCGVYQYGRRLYDILKPVGWFVYREINGVEDYNRALSEAEYNIVIYNYHNSTMKWLTRDNIQKKVKNIGILHESPGTIFDSVLSLNPEDAAGGNYLTRPLFENISELLSCPTPYDTLYSCKDIEDFINLGRDTITEVPIFGSFGFGFKFKGFDKIVALINSKYDRAIIKFVCPPSHFDPCKQDRFKRLNKECRSQITKPGIELHITDMFITDTDMLLFLASNTANLFLYDKLDGRSISSATDFALSVNVPLVISNSDMFRHIYHDSICPDKTELSECITNSIALCSEYRAIHTNQRLRATICWNILRSVSNSQAGQDMFAWLLTHDKAELNTYLEIGANHPIKTNNTYMLEKIERWRGIMVEYDPGFRTAYNVYRPLAKAIIGDARNVDYAAELKDYPADMGYLQIDLDADNRSTLDVLELLDRTVLTNKRFATITFETDIYRGNFFNTRERARDILKSRGYVLLAGDVEVYWEGGNKPFEDWWVHPELINPKWLDKAREKAGFWQDIIKSYLA